MNELIYWALAVFGLGELFFIIMLKTMGNNDGDWIPAKLLSFMVSAFIRDWKRRLHKKDIHAESLTVASILLTAIICYLS